jgi:hypothetical protein
MGTSCNDESLGEIWIGNKNDVRLQLVCPVSLIVFATNSCGPGPVQASTLKMVLNILTAIAPTFVYMGTDPLACSFLDFVFSLTVCVMYRKGLDGRTQPWLQVQSQYRNLHTISFIAHLLLTSRMLKHFIHLHPSDDTLLPRLCLPTTTLFPAESVEHPDSSSFSLNVEARKPVLHG